MRMSKRVAVSDDVPAPKHRKSTRVKVAVNYDEDVLHVDESALPLPGPKRTQSGVA